MLRRRALRSRGAGVLALRLHLGQHRFRAGARASPGLPEEAWFHPPDPPAPVRARRTSDRAGRYLRRHAVGGRPPPPPAGRPPAPGGPPHRPRPCPSHGPPPPDAVARERTL